MRRWWFFNLLIFEKGTSTQDIWFYEHRVPSTQKAYSMTRPIRLEHMQGCVDWWGGADREGRVETDVAWKVSADEVKARGQSGGLARPAQSHSARSPIALSPAIVSPLMRQIQLR